MAKLPPTTRAEFETELTAISEREFREAIERMQRAADDLQKRILNNAEALVDVQKQLGGDNPLFGAIERPRATRGNRARHVEPRARFRGNVRAADTA